jgi:hypothetical protein
MYSMTPKNLFLFLDMSINNTKFYADLKSVDIIARKCTQKTLFFLLITFLLANFSHFSPTVLKSERNSELF